jgi:hypothetical protein
MTNDKFITQLNVNISNEYEILKEGGSSLAVPHQSLC